MYLSNKAKTIIGIVAGVVVIAGVIGGSIAIANAVKKNKQANCEHVYDEGQITVEATCETDGVKLYTCSECDYELMEEILALGHTEVEIEGVAATCTETGLTDGVSCLVCEKVLAQPMEVPALGHKPVEDAAVAPTCTTSGKTAGSHSPLEEGNFYENGNDYIVRFRLQNVLYKNMNRNFVCMLVLKTTSGSSVTYKYSAYPAGVDYRSNARSVAYVAAASLNAYVLGMESFTDVELGRLRNYINQSVDIANGKENPTDDGSMYAFATNITAPQTLSVGETLTINTTISPDVNVPVWYRSSDEAIIQVDNSGKVTAKAKGTAVVGIYVAGESYGITIKVS